MKTASRILGTAFFIEGYEIQDAPRYGAERRGAPIFAFVRADKKPIFERGIIQNPDLVVVADDSLVPIPAAGVLAGTDSHSVLLINSHEAANNWKDRLNFQGETLILPAAGEIEDRAELPYAGAACAGAAARLVGVISYDGLKAAIEEEIGHLGERVLEKNLQVATEAYDRMQPHSGMVTECDAPPVSEWKSPGWVSLELEQAKISAPIIHAGMTSNLMPTGLWRTMRPKIDYDRCNRCWWVCSTFCPDSAISVDEEKHPQIDYDHCKGCLICVAQCPPHAITAVPEHSPGEGAPS
jgi:pyruvate ferredoxin oxidoreductase gamma subunit